MTVHNQKAAADLAIKAVEIPSVVNGDFNGEFNVEINVAIGVKGEK